MTDSEKRLNGRPFTLSRTKQERDTTCPHYTVKANRHTAGIAIEFCVHKENLAEFMKSASRLINCVDCNLL